MKRFLPAYAFAAILMSHAACARESALAPSPAVDSAPAFSCESLNGSDFIAEGENFVIEYYVMAQPGFDIPGRSMMGVGHFSFKQRQFNTIEGEAAIDRQPFPVALTGPGLGVEKKFLTPKGFGLRFLESRVTRREFIAYGGLFDNRIWSVSPPRKLLNPLYCIRRGDRILSTGAGGPRMASPPVVRRAPPPMVLPTPAPRPATPPPPRPAPVMTLPPVTSPSFEKRLTTPSAVTTPSTMSTFAAYTPAAPVTPRAVGVNGACDRRLSAIDIVGGLPEEIAFIGRVARPQVAEYWYSPSVDIFPEPIGLDMGGLFGQYVRLEASSDERLEVDEAGTMVMPVRFPGIDGLRKTGAAAPPPPEPDTIRLMILGDPATLAEAGLAEFGGFLQRELPGYLTDVTWHSIGKNGALDDAAQFFNLADLADRVADLSTTDPRARLDTEAEMRAFYAALIRELDDAPRTYDAVLWITPGTQFPVETPGLTRSMIRDVHRDGNIRRTDDGSPAGDWLYIYSSQIAGFSGAFFREVIERETPRPGIFVERGAGSGGAIIENPELVAKRLRRLVSTGKAAPEASEEEDGTRHVNLDEAMDDVGVVMTRDILDRMVQASAGLRVALSDRSAGWDNRLRTLFASAYDPTALLELRSDELGQPRSYRTDARTPERIGMRLLTVGAGTDSRVDLEAGLERLRLLEARLRSLRDQLPLNSSCTHGVLYLDSTAGQP